MRYLLIVMLLFLSVFCGQVAAQDSNTEPISFLVLPNNTEESDRLIVESQPYHMFGCVSGAGATILSVSPDITNDSIDVLTKYHERNWALTIKDIDDATVTVGLREYGRAAPRGEFIDKFTYTDQFRFRTDSLFKYVSGCTFDYTVTFADSSLIVEGEVYHVYFHKTRLLQASDLGALGIFSLPNADTLTILVWDTLTSAEDTIYTTAVPGDMGYTSLFIDQYPAINTNQSMFGLGLQVKIADGQWARPMDNTRDKVKVLADSVVADSAVVVDRVNNVPADSVRYAVWGKAAADVIIRAIKALWRD